MLLIYEVVGLEAADVAEVTSTPRQKRGLSGGEDGILLEK